MKPLDRVLIRGDGVAAACCAHLLRRSGIAVRTEDAVRSRVPALVLSAPALALIRDVFERPTLMADSPAIDRRMVAWTLAADPVALPHAAIVTSEGALLAALPVGRDADFDGQPDLVVQTGAAPAADAQRRFGAREAAAVQVRLKEPDDLSACWIEALDEGWLFLAPSPEGPSWLLAVGAPPERLALKSRLIGPRIELTDRRSAVFDVCPRIATACSGDGWLACGTAAVAFDPICGDGVAQAVRGAVLAAATIVAIREGGSAPQLLGHYDSMLVAAMRRHLKLCADHYGPLAANPWWSGELLALADGYRWCTEKLAIAPEPAFELRGLRLTPREAAA